MQTTCASRIVRRLFLGVSLLSVSGAAIAQSPFRGTNPYTSGRLQQMKQGGYSPSSNPRKAFGQTPFERLILPGAQKAMASRLHRYVTPAAGEAPQPFSGLLIAPFVPAVPASDANGVYSSAVADFDGKNGPDVVTVQVDGNLNLLANDGKGNLSLTSSNSSALKFNAEVVYVQAADLNQDGYADIVAVDANNSAVLVYLNKGDGTFANAVSMSATPASGAVFADGGSLAVADVNGDGIPDIVAVTNLQIRHGAVYSSVISEQTFLGNGDGSFKKPAPSQDVPLRGYYFTQFGSGIALADVNADHKTDLVEEICDPINGRVYVSAALGNGTGGFAPLTLGTSMIPAPLLTSSNMLVQDLNGDGNPDALLTVGDGAAYVALGNHDGSFQKPAAALTDIPSASTIQLGDFNGDTHADLLVFSLGSVALFPGHGDGTFDLVAKANYAGGAPGDQQPVPADFNADGKLDFAWVDSQYSQAALYTGTGTGTFIASAAIAPSNASTSLPNNTESPANILLSATGDMNGDGKLDVIAEDYTNPFYDPFGGRWPDIVAGFGDGAENFSFKTLIRGQDLYHAKAFELAPVAADFDGTGRADAIIETPTGLLLLSVKTDGTVQAPRPIAFPSTAGCSFNIDIGDLNHDGRLDAVAAYQGASPSCLSLSGKPTPSGYFTLLNNGDGNFHTTFTPFAEGLYEARLIDVNGDGNLDLVTDAGFQNNGILICETCPTPIDVLPGKGDGTFDISKPVPVLKDWRIADIVPGDFDGDGHQDLTLLSQSQIGNDGLVPETRGVAFLRGHGDFTFSEPQLAAVDSTSLQGVYVDLNHTGKPDLVFSLAESFQAVPTYFGMMLLANQGDGTFAAPLNLIEPTSDSEVLVADVNGDGAPDLLATRGAASAIYLNRRGTSLTLSAQPEAATQDEPVTLTAKLGTVAGAGDAAGTVTFSSNGAPLGSAPVSGGVAELQTSALAVGTDSLTAAYSGDDAHAPANSNAVAVTVEALPPSFTMQASPTTTTIVAGDAVKVSLTLAANATFTGGVTFSCAGLPRGASCVFAPATVSLSGGQSATASATIVTTGARTQSQAMNRPWKGVAAGGVLACCLLLWPGRRRDKRLLWPLLLLMLASTPLAFLAGCGGNSKSNPNQTPAGNATIVVTASGTSGGAAITQSSTITVQVTQ